LYFKGNVTVLDRIMYLICVGGGGGGDGIALHEMTQMTLYALGVLRSSLNAPQASLMVLHTLAPPVDYDVPVPTN
jgi:hypothetical protein